MRKIISALLILLSSVLLVGCGDKTAINNSNAATRAARIAAISQQLDAMESLLDGVDYGSKTRSALRSAQNAQNKAIKKQNDNKSGIFNRDGDYYVDKFEEAVNKLQQAMNADSKVREAAERQASVASDERQSLALRMGSYRSLIIFAVGAVIVLLIFLALSGMSKKPKDIPAPEQHKSEAPKKVEEQPRASLARTSEGRFMQECKELGHDPEEVLAFFDGDENRAHTYISMELNYKNMGIEKDYKQLCSED